MSEQDEKFTLENLDHLSEEFAQGDSSLPEVRLLQDLQWAQKTHDRIVTRATERVWQRLQASEHLSEHLKEAATDTYSISSIPPPQSLTKNIRKGILNMNNLDAYGIRPQRRGRRFFTEVAAVLLVGIVASMFLIFTQYYHAQTGRAGIQQSISTQNTQKASAPAFLYVTAQGGVAKLDKQTGKVLWTFRAPDSQQLQPPLEQAQQGPATNITTSAENTVYVTNSAISTSGTKTGTFILHVYAINAQNGSLRWSYTNKGDQASSNPVLAGNILYVAANEGVAIQILANGSAMGNATGSSLAALDTRDGHLLWRTPLKGVGGESLAVKNGLVYASITNGELNRTSIHGVEALHVQSGTPAWWALTPGLVTSQLSFQVTDTLIYDITMESDKNVTFVHAFDALNGDVRWSSAPITGVTITGVTPVLSNGVLYFCANFGSEGNSTGKIFALDAASGHQLQVSSLPLELYELLPIDGHVYLSYASHSGFAPDLYGSAGLLALDKTMTLGHHLWLDSAINEDNAFPSSLSLENGLLYFLADHQVEAANPATGKIVWQQQLPDYINIP